ncbi:MAG: rod shape-determining protein MreC [Myxococcales bacterium]|nr:rod shape-determining protein MreC [Myxococcales bacterium]MDD9965753.1 rod shape-determining protein MreC [Myxococcales bacterium]
MSFFRRFRDAAICVVLLGLPFFFLRANLKSPDKVNAIDRFVVQSSAPMQYLATQLALGVSSYIQDYVYLVEVKRENERLQTENARLREAKSKLLSAAAENRRLRKLLQLREHLKGSMLAAQVIGKEVSQFFRVIRVRLDRGTRDRVEPGMPVLTSEGLVGQVQRTSGRYSDVLLTADKTSAIDVVVQRTGARGMLKGTGDAEHYLCRLENLSRDAEAKVGDAVVTSGLGQRFPASILVGHIAKLRKKKFGLYQEAEVAPAVNFSLLEEVLIMTAGSRTQAAKER